MKRKIFILTTVCLLLMQNPFLIRTGYCSYPVEADFYETVEEPEKDPDESEEERKEREELEEAIHETTDREENYPYY